LPRTSPRTSDAAPPAHTNRLANETSPYLLQHQHNPVDWYPWGPEAFERARRENKPIFLSVGYSTCYWCHVMERQSFENESIAAEMNRRFVNIKVDREERPDVDQLYMTAVQVLTRHGGWPMSVFLTPDLRPFYGGTYFPPTDSYGRPGFVTVLRGIEDAYRNRPGDVQKTSEQLVDILGQLAEPSPPDQPVSITDAFVESLVERSTSDYESVHGGFGSAPKFPRETLLELILVHNRHSPSEQRMRMLRHTLDAMADGGIRDQLGGGFHRYSTDAQWLVPHFEIMLYDNAMLAWVYTEASRQTGERRYADVARGVFNFVLREMTSPEGPFYTAFDAEVDAQEGLSYLWTAEEIERLLGPADAKIFNKVYGVDRGPNFADPHHGSGAPDKNILFLPKPIEEVASELAMTVESLEAVLEPMRQTLYQARLKRKQPLLDTKVLTSWNALMIRALAFGGQVLNEPRYLDAAAKAADFLLSRHPTPDGGLYRTSRDGSAKYAGFLDDYAFLAQALLALHEAGQNGHWHDAAEALALTMIGGFGDAGAGGFYFTERDAKDLIVRQKVASDSPLPSGNAVAAMVLLDLGRVEEVRNTLAVFAQSLENNAEGMSSMVQAAALYLRRAEPFTVSAAPEAGGGAGSADRPLSPQELAAGVVSVAARWDSAVELHVRLNILKGFHVNAHQPGAPKDLPLVSTTLTVVGEAARRAHVEYPPGEEQRFAFADQPIRVYNGEVTLVVRLVAPLPSGSSVRLNLSYQACDDTACLPPVTKQVEVSV
jgi:uncharacterized protein YyaL (SSP411 family)